MDDLSDLITRAQEGDKDAFGEIYQLFYRRIYRYCLFNTAKHETAQDLCQETFFRAWKSLSAFSQKGGSFQAYLFKIARNLIIDLARKKKEVPLENYDEPDNRQSPDKSIERQDDIKKVRNALLKLDFVERQIIILRYFEEMTTAETARAIGLREGALRVRTHRVLKKLKNILETTW